MGGRYRMIKPDFWEDQKIAQLSDKAKLLFIALWNFADDEGYLENNPKWIKIKCFPYEKNLKIEKYLTELLQFSLISEKNGLFHITNFLKHQKIKKPTPSKLAKKWGTSGEPLENSYSPLNKEKLSKVKESKEKEKENGESPEPPFDNPEKPNDTKNGTASNCEDSTKSESLESVKESIPQGFKALVDYLVRQGYEQSKAELVANLSQSVTGYVLSHEHIKIFKTNSEDEIKSTFSVLTMGLAAAKGKKVNAGKEAGFTTFGKGT